MKRGIRLLMLPPLLLCAVSISSVDTAASEECIAVKTYEDKQCGDQSIPRNDLVMLMKVGDCAELSIHARSRWNASKLKLSKGASYTFETEQSDSWLDNTIKTNAGGWEHVPLVEGKKEIDSIGEPDLERGVMDRAMFSFYSPFKRMPDSRWYELIGVISAKGCKTSFPIGLGRDYSPAYDGQFCGFANDHPWFYFNNSGSVKLTITRTK